MIPDRGYCQIRRHTHFTAVGTLEIGRRYAEALLKVEARPAPSKQITRQSILSFPAFATGRSAARFKIGWRHTGFSGE